MRDATQTPQPSRLVQSAILVSEQHLTPNFALLVTSFSLYLQYLGPVDSAAPQVATAYKILGALLMEGGVLGVNDGIVLGMFDVGIDGVDDGTDDEQIPHVALQVWKKPTIPQLSLPLAHVCLNPLIINTNFESVHSSQVSHVTGQCVLMLLILHLFFLAAQLQGLLLD